MLTDSAVYHLQREPSAYRAWVRAAYVNRTGAPVAFARCTRDATGPIFFVHRAGSDSTRPMFSDWGWACVGGVPTGALAPGDSLVVRVPLGTLDQPRMQPRLEAAWLTGQFRVALELCAPPVAGSDECRRLPLAARASKSFEVRFAPGVEPP